MPAKPASDTITIENLGRSVWHFPFTVEKGPDRVSEITGYLTIGDSADKGDDDGMITYLNDRTGQFRVPRVQHLTPNPVVTISRSDWDLLAPTHQAVINHLICIREFTTTAAP